MNLFRRYQKLFVIIIFLSICFLIGYFIWSLFFRATETEIIIDEEGQIISNFPNIATGTQSIIDKGGQVEFPFEPTTPSVPLPDDSSLTAEGGVTVAQKLGDDKTSNSTLSSDGGVQYYNKDDGKFYKIDENGKAVVLSDKVFFSVEDVTWAPNKDKAILEYPDGRKILYNFNTEKQASLPSHWQDFSFSPSSNQLVSKSIGLDPTNSWLIVSNDDGSKAKAIEKIGTNANIVYPAWSPAQQIVGLYTGGVDFNRQEIFFIGQNDENFKSTIIEGRGLEFQWSSEGDRLLYSVWNTEDNLNPRLWLVSTSVDSIGQGRRSLDLMTWAHKCTFATNTEVYCAVPQSLPEGAGLFPELADQTKDILYKIDLATGAKKLLAIPDGAYNVSEIMVPESQNVLYFTDKKTNELYKVDL